VEISSGALELKNGTISGNTATTGGGVSVSSSYGTFTKTGGTIYGDSDTTNTPPKNTATDGATRKGHAVYYDFQAGTMYCPHGHSF
jgi:uncharacterized protein with beta-barrel porin domain